MATRPLTLQQQIELCQQIASLTRSQLPLEGQLAEIARSGSGSLADSAKHIEQQLAQGKSLADSMADQSDGASRTLAACIESGQQSGQLDQALESWTSMHIANAQSGKRFGVAMVYPCILISVMFVSISFSIWHLIPEIRDTYALFSRQLPGWLNLLVAVREHFVWLVASMFVATGLPLLINFWRRRATDRQGVPKSQPLRLRLQALAARLASLQLAASRPLSEIAPRLLTAMGLPPEQSSDAFGNLRTQKPLGPLSPETSLLLGSLYAGVIDPNKAVQLLDTVSEQLNYQAEVIAQREARWLPMLVALTVCTVTLITYAVLIYLPWIHLMQKIGSV